MSLIEINYIFSAGFRCYSTSFLKDNNYRKISGPFDHICIDLETVFKIINDNFNLFLSDIVFYNKKLNKFYIKYSKDGIIKDKLHMFKSYDYICYMRHDYEGTSLMINQNYINNISNNLFYWDKACIFMHHNIVIPKDYKIIKDRVNIFKNIYIKIPKNICLVHITRIEIFENFDEYKNKIIEQKHKFKINCYLILIICSSILEESYLFEKDILFIIKKVDDYDTQYNGEIGNDNNFLDYTKEKDIISKYFKFNLKDYNYIKQKFN